MKKTLREEWVEMLARLPHESSPAIQRARECLENAIAAYDSRPATVQMPKGPPQAMVPCRPEMRSEPCWGPLGKEPCGRTVEVRCSRCYAHRCVQCALHGELCPICATLDDSAPEVH